MISKLNCDDIMSIVTIFWISVSIRDLLSASGYLYTSRILSALLLWDSLFHNQLYPTS